MLLIHARREARTGPDGVPLLLDEQDRGRWDRALIEEGGRLVSAALTGGPAGRYPKDNMFPGDIPTPKPQSPRGKVVAPGADVTAIDKALGGLARVELQDDKAGGTR